MERRESAGKDSMERWRLATERKMREDDTEAASFPSGDRDGKLWKERGAGTGDVKRRYALRV